MRDGKVDEQLLLIQFSKRCSRCRRVWQAIYPLKIIVLRLLFSSPIIFAEARRRKKSKIKKPLMKNIPSAIRYEPNDNPTFEFAESSLRHPTPPNFPPTPPITPKSVTHTHTKTTHFPIQTNQQTSPPSSHHKMNSSPTSTQPPSQAAPPPSTISTAS